ncbi:MAG: biotin/lipoate A/B protein ligase family protein [Cyanobacteriota bacterium]|nr:biotin/lipoate A/B protein ligase family protein [Cyanobacteriota bacterium]
MTNDQQRAKTWRFIPLLNAPGTVQMQIDRWLLEQQRKGDRAPTLRFYTWDPAAISLGYHQRNYPEFWRELHWQRKPIDIVRRPTGGRAVLHQGDLTYALVTSELANLRRAIAYETLCTFLIEGWRSLGLELHYGAAGRGYIRHPSCFSTATAADLVTERGEKLIGSAQVRRDRALLQHGSMRLSSDPGLFEEVFGEAIAPMQFPFSLKGDELVQTVVEAMIQAARTSFNIEFAIAPLSETEWEEIRAINIIG